MRAPSRLRVQLIVQSVCADAEATNHIIGEPVPSTNQSIVLLSLLRSSLLVASSRSLVDS